MNSENSNLPALNLSSTVVRLRSDASTETLPVDDTFWQRLVSGQLGSFKSEFLVTCHTFDADWGSWEQHPKGDEIVCLLSGAAEFLLETANGQQAVVLNEPGDYVIVPAGTWHTAKVARAAHMLFITPGEGTQHREIEENT